LLRTLGHMFRCFPAARSALLEAKCLSAEARFALHDRRAEIRLRGITTAIQTATARRRLLELAFTERFSPLCCPPRARRSERLSGMIDEVVVDTTFPVGTGLPIEAAPGASSK